MWLRTVVGADRQTVMAEASTVRKESMLTNTPNATVTKLPSPTWRLRDFDDGSWMRYTMEEVAEFLGGTVPISVTIRIEYHALRCC